MKVQKILAMLMVLMVTSIGSALAHGVRGNVGIYFGPSWGSGFYPSPFYSPFYYPQQVIVVPAAPPPVYIEQRQAPVDLAPAAQQYWHYCNSSKGYYPYVKECPEGWQQVLPQPQR